MSVVVLVGYFGWLGMCTIMRAAAERDVFVI